MKLIGILDSPYVRRVAITLKLLELPFEHEPLSVFRTYEQFRHINPLVKAPTLVCDDGSILVDSTLILEYIDAQVDPAKQLPRGDASPQRILQTLGIALVACEKTVQLVYENNLRPAEKRHQPWIDRVTEQLLAAYRMLEAVVVSRDRWLFGPRLTQADVTVAVAWRFTQFVLPRVVEAARFPMLSALSERAERLPEFLSTPLA
jgi:glutathione S-transferase